MEKKVDIVLYLIKPIQLPRMVDSLTAVRGNFQLRGGFFYGEQDVFCESRSEESFGDETWEFGIPASNVELILVEPDLVR